MRIAYVLRIFPKLSETFIVSELAELRRRNVEVRILSLLPPREDLRHVLVDEAGLSALTVYDQARFLDELRDFRPDILHAHFATEAAAAARELAAQVGVPFTFTAHGYDIYRKPPPDWSARADAAAAVVTVSQTNARSIAKRYGVSRNRIAVVYPGVDVERFQRDGLPAEPALIVCVARLAEVKNIPLLLRATALLRERGIPFRCVVVGDGPLRDDVVALREQLDLRDSVEFVGAATDEDVLRWWRRASVGALPSANEGFPVSLLEAAACAVPVVATAVGGVPELVVDGTTGLLVAPEDADAFAASLARLLQNVEEARRLGAAARRRVEDHFRVEAQVDRLLEVWTRVAAGVPA
jgi:colanic acid/amylovoran biosynthesis glycosyltransferase